MANEPPSLPPATVCVYVCANMPVCVRVVYLVLGVCVVCVCFVQVCVFVPVVIPGS